MTFSSYVCVLYYPGVFLLSRKGVRACTHGVRSIRSVYTFPAIMIYERLT